MNEEPQVSSAKRTALLRYMAILFAVAFLLVLLSYLIQVFNSQDTISQLNATSASALQNAERLQDTNRELSEKNQELQSALTDARAATQEYQESVSSAIEIAHQEGAMEAQAVYDLLLQAIDAQAREDYAGMKAALMQIEGQEAVLSAEARAKLEALKKLPQVE